MSDDETRGSTRTFALKNERTRPGRDAKVQVRMTNGKIYGPYTRPEILSFIAEGKIKGEEQILIEGETSWRAITSDNEFFDALQAQLMGLTYAPATKASKPEITSVKKPVVLEPTEVTPAPKSSAPPAKPEKPRPKKVDVRAGKPRTIEEARARAPQFPDLKVEEPLSRPEPPEKSYVPSVQTAPRKKERNFKPLILGLLAVLGAGALWQFATPFAPKRPAGPRNLAASPFANRLWYAKPLSLWLSDFQVSSPALPARFQTSEAFTLPEGMGAPVWVNELKNLAKEEDPTRKLQAAYWARWSWSELWLAATAEAFDARFAQVLKNDGEQILTELRRQKVLPLGIDALFRSLPLAFSGKFFEAANELRQGAGGAAPQILPWLIEEFQWQAFWSRGAKGTLDGRQLKEYSSLRLELGSLLRESLLRRDPHFLDWVVSLSDEDPTANALWFAAAEYNWRLSGSAQIAQANALFLTGLSTLSLLPGAFQEVYWSQYGQFLQAFGRQSTAAKAELNRKLLEKGDIEHAAPTQWWDLNQEGLEVNSLAQEILAHAGQGMLNPRDLATLQVLGSVMPGGAEHLVAAGNHWAFEGQWDRAAKLFEDATRVSKNFAPAWGGLTWAYANQYQFDKAFKAHDQLQQSPETDKFQGVIELVGREYENAAQHLRAYIRSAPQDGWGHYFQALLALATDKNVDCVKAANLARFHGRGELRFRADLLFSRCRVRGRVGTKQALKDLEVQVKKNPENLPLRLTYIDALSDADLSDQALKVAQQSLLKYPRSFELRMKLAECFERVRDYDKAVAFYSRATRDRPDSVEPLVRIGRIFEGQKRYLEAARNFETASRLDPSYPEVWLFTARAYAQAGRIPDAASMYFKEIEARPAVLSSFIEAAEFLLKINAPQEVPVLFRKFKSDFQDDPRVMTRLAQAYLALKEYDNAQNAAANALARNRQLPEPNRILGYVYEEHGQMEEARRYFERYLELLPQAADADEIRSKLQNPPFGQ